MTRLKELRSFKVTEYKLVEKPWGYYVDIYRPKNKKVVFKRIIVDPDHQLS